MPPTKVALAYVVNVFGSSVADMLAAIGAVPLVPLDSLGVSTFADDFGVQSGPEQVTRTITLSIVQPSVTSVHNPPVSSLVPSIPPTPYPWTGSIASTSDEDAAGGTGATIVDIHYLDVGGNPHVNAGVVLNGRSPVALPTSNHSTVTSVVLAATGSLGTSAGQLTVKADPLKGLPIPGVPSRPQPAPIVAVLSPGYRGQLLPGADLAAAFRQMFRGVLQQAMRVPVLALDPVLS